MSNGPLESRVNSPSTIGRQRLDPDVVLLAYTKGFFPMAESREGPIAWYSPDPRAIIPLDQLRVSRSLRRRVRERHFDVRVDTAFDAVIRQCAQREETWISEEIIRVYTLLFRRGAAHSVEAWKEGTLAGGLYGLALGGAFFGESMFSLVTDASKVALVHLVAILREAGFVLLDTQFMTEHLRQLGAREVPREEYLTVLSQALQQKVDFPLPRV